MFRHQYKCHKSIVPSSHGPVDRLAEQFPPVIVRQQGHSAIARERQFVQITGFEIMSNSLPMSGHENHLGARRPFVIHFRRGQKKGTQFNFIDAIRPLPPINWGFPLALSRPHCQEVF